MIAAYLLTCWRLWTKTYSNVSIKQRPIRPSLRYCGTQPCLVLMWMESLREVMVKKACWDHVSGKERTFLVLLFLHRCIIKIDHGIELNINWYRTKRISPYPFSIKQVLRILFYFHRTVKLVYNKNSWDSKMVVAVGRGSLFGDGPNFKHDRIWF